MLKVVTVEVAENLCTGRARRVDKESAIKFVPAPLPRRVTGEKPACEKP